MRLAFGAVGLSSLCYYLLFFSEKNACILTKGRIIKIGNAVNSVREMHSFTPYVHCGCWMCLLDIDKGNGEKRENC